MPQNNYTLGSQVPQRGNALSRVLGLLLLRLSGWRVAGEFPDVPKAVLALAPHTSNMDGVVVAMIILATRMRVGLMAKSDIFKPPFGGVARWLGGIPIDRSSSRNMVEQTVAKFEEKQQLWLGISPEGTRSNSSSWKTGFYHIARQANVHIIVLALDYGRRELRVADHFLPSGDMAADMPRIMACFKGVQGHHPERLSQPLVDLNKTPD
jgi:1-acyl-sn-glycerol-3-phosphate acyltransferase